MCSLELVKTKISTQTLSQGLVQSASKGTGPEPDEMFTLQVRSEFY